MKDEIRAFYGRWVGELWTIGWALGCAALVGLVIWWWG